ncbi:hypothetical protein INR49_008329 [Caranx melampygus]|nr:hypothetical protein INR49_008329 [Caranx melampygus]
MTRTGKSFRQRWAMIPAARASPRTLIIVRNLSLQRQRRRGDTRQVWTQSIATMSVMSSGGNPTDVRTITMVTRPAWGIPAAPMLAAVAVMLQRNRITLN